jgi:predicted DCC family thiol-disulfide oxidoreductase YuxK
MAQMVHVRLRDGTVRTGFDAWREILFELDGWRWLARVSGLPWLRRLGPVIYSILTKNRHRLPLNKA